MEAREDVSGDTYCGKQNGVRRMITIGHMRSHMRIRPGDSSNHWRSADVPQQAETGNLNGSTPLRQWTDAAVERPGQAAGKARPVRSESLALLMVTRDIGPFIHKVSDRLHEWLERRSQRRELLSMSDHMLRDIGISRADAEEEWRKSFWR